MKKTLLVVLAGALLLGAAGLAVPAGALAAEMKPVAVVALASYDELVSDVAFVGKLAEKPELGTALEGVVAMVTQGKGLAGIDKSRPWGIIAQTDGRQIVGYGFLPVSDVKQIRELVELYADVKDQGNGVAQVTPRNQNKSFYAKVAGGWLFTAEQAAHLAHISARPLATLGGMEKHYLVAGRLYAANVPAAEREKLVAKIKHDTARDAARKSGESDQDFATRQKIIGTVRDMVLGMINDVDQITAGWAVDRRAEKSYLDVSITARPGTPTAQQCALLENMTSNFAGFRLPGAALAGNWSGKIPGAKMDLFSTVIEAVRTKALDEIVKQQKPADEARIARELVGDVAELLQKTVKSGKCDGGLAVLLDPHAVTGVAGGYVADGALLDKALRILADAAKKQNPAVGELVKFDADRQQDIRFHTISLPIPAEANDREKVVQAIGEKLEVVIGVGPQSVYLAAGRDALATLKRAIAASADTSRTVLPVQFAIGLEPVARFVAAMGKEQDRPKAQLVANELKKTPGVDHVSLTVRPIANGVQYRLEVEQGLVRLVGRLAAMARPGR